MRDVYECHAATSEICVIAFSTHGAKEFEWRRSLNDLGVSYVLVRDTSERWYTEGVSGIGGQEEVATFLHNVTRNYKRRIALGLSSGAYGALLFGAKIPAHEIIAISPVTVLGHSVAHEFEPQWRRRLGLSPPLSRDLDLRPLYTNGSRRTVRAFVSDGDGAELDARMCELIGVAPTLISGHSHAKLARHMVDAGMIRDLILGET